MVDRLEGRELTFSYPGGARAVQGVSLELARGDFLAVLGPNGAGKSTLLRLLAGLLGAERGEVRIDGAPLAALTPRERAKRIAVVPQSLVAVPEVRVDDFVLGGRYAHLSPWKRAGGSDRSAVDRALAEADASEVADRPLTELSGGQRQRVLIARALAQEAEVLLVDEPSNSLDPQHQIAVFDLLAKLTCEGRAVLVVTHDLNLASQFATRALLMKDGHGVATGTPSEILRPDVLGPVYGPHLRYGTFPGPRGGTERPFVIPWLA